MSHRDPSCRGGADSDPPVDPEERAIPSPWRMSLADWKDVLARVWHEIDDDHVTVVAAGMAFFMLLAVLPLLTVLVSVYGLVADPVMVERQVSVLAALVPSSAWSVVNERLQLLIDQPSSVLGLGFLAGLAGSLWAVSSGANTLLQGVNIAYDERETRSYLALRWLALKLTVAMVGFGVLAFGLVALLPLAMNAMGWQAGEQGIVRILRWPIMLLAGLFGLAYVYRVAPNRTRPRWRWVSLGSGVATLLWLLGSALFSAYVDLAGNFDRSYGSAGGIVIFMLWLYVSALAVLLGAELNAELEHQTALDTTVGPDKPMGERGAWVADGLGASHQPREPLRKRLERALRRWGKRGLRGRAPRWSRDRHVQ